ncbi:MAG: L-histidine N(alpha)-methyltransferase [Actinobacteria bacterium]|nr:L-histidine N(alpha)-methyltransferase [Actinomycetota bacterium]
MSVPEQMMTSGNRNTGIGADLEIDRTADGADCLGEEAVNQFALMVVRGLSDQPRRLDSRYLYDANGSFIFERICEQPEYYLTRTEAGILADAAAGIARHTGHVTLIELGSGSSIKTRLLLDAYCERYGSVKYAPVDISKSILEEAEADICAAHPAVEVHSLHGDFEQAFPLLGTLSPSMLLFLGSTIGNLDSHEAALFWDRVSLSLSSGDFCLLGVDINENAGSLHSAYNDAAGFSEAFTRNIFIRMNRELGASLDPDLIDHVAHYDRKWRRVEIFAHFLEEQEIAIEPLGSTFRIGAGEYILTEVSRKFRLEQMVPYLGTFGLETQRIFTDSGKRFAVLLLRRK